jgi:hypothetical protein
MLPKTVPRRSIVPNHRSPHSNIIRRFPRPSPVLLVLQGIPNPPIVSQAQLYFAQIFHLGFRSSQTSPSSSGGAFFFTLSFLPTPAAPPLPQGPPSSPIPKNLSALLGRLGGLVEESKLILPSPAATAAVAAWAGRGAWCCGNSCP